MAGGSTPTANPNKRLYNGGSEWQDDIDGLAGYYSTFFREYDAVIGRFNGVDPMAEAVDELSTYAYGGNNPIMMNDPLGLLYEGGTKTRGRVYLWGPDYKEQIGVEPFTEVTYYQPKMGITQWLAWGDQQMGGGSNEVREGAFENNNSVGPGPNLYTAFKLRSQSKRNFGTYPLVNPLPNSPNPFRIVNPPGKIIPFSKPTFGIRNLPFLSAGIFGSIGLTILGVLMPLPAGEGSFRKPVFEEPIILYRGVSADHPDIENARMGVATPWGGNSDPERHQGGNSRSNYTSWTISIGVATFHANKQGLGKSGLGGIVLMKAFFPGEYLPNLRISDEGEFLVPGVVRFAVPLNPNGFGFLGFPTMY